MGLLRSFVSAPNTIPNIYETVPFVVGTASQGMTAAQAVGCRVYLPYGPILVTHLGYLVVTAAGNVELAICRPTTKDGLVLTPIGSTGSVATSGSSVVQTAALTTPTLMMDGDVLVLNPSSTVTIRVASTYATAGALKNRTVTKGSAPLPLTEQTFATSLAYVPYLVAYGS